MIHEVKCWPTYFNSLIDGSKRFEVRKKDRPYRVGDYLAVNEYRPNSEDPYDDWGELPLSKDERHVSGGRYSGRCALFKITFILDNKDFCRDDMVILGISIMLEGFNA